MLRVLFGAFLLLGISAQTYAQDLPPIRELFRVDSGFSGAFSPGELEGYGFGGILEIKYNINPYLSVGSRTDGTILVGVDIDSAGEDVNAGITIDRESWDPAQKRLRNELKRYTDGSNEAKKKAANENN